MIIRSNSLPASVGGAALGLVISLNALSSPGIAMPRTKADFRGGHSSASAEQLRKDPWAQAEYRNALTTLLGWTQVPEILMGTGSCLQVPSAVVDIQSPEYGGETHVTVQGVHTTSEVIAMVRSTLGLQITQLASILRVQRPTVYAWIDDRAKPHPENRERLHQLYRFAREWEQLSDRPMATRLGSVRPDGKSLLDLLTADTIREADVREWLRTLASQKETAVPARRVLSVRELAVKHGIPLPSESAGQLEIDRMTGKRTSME